MKWLTNIIATCRNVVKTAADAVTKKNNMEITQMPIDVHITKLNRKIKYLVIHYTAGAKSTKGSAEANRNVFLKRDASADFVVDDEKIIQVNPDPTKYYCWAVGDGKGKYGIYNKDCISIEMCSTLKKGTSAAKPNHDGWSISEAVLEKTIELTKYLMEKYNIPIENVIRHYDATRKSCPGIVGWNTGALYTTAGVATGKKNTEEKWLSFKERLK